MEQPRALVEEHAEIHAMRPSGRPCRNVLQTMMQVQVCRCRLRQGPVEFFSPLLGSEAGFGGCSKLRQHGARLLTSHLYLLQKKVRRKTPCNPLGPLLATGRRPRDE
jgi:hypothetical protein